MKPVVFSGPVFGGHRTGLEHPESPDRWTRLSEALAGREGLILEPPISTGPEMMLLAHDADYLERLMALCRGGGGFLDADTVLSADSFDVASAAAGSTLAGLAHAMAGTPVFVAARPPGHHASRARGMGFCLVNHVALAARQACSLGAGRVAILDWDVHHGNGTQELVTEWPDVAFLSLHQDGHWPGTGATGDSSGGRIRNIGLPMRTGHEAYLAVFERLVLPWLDRQAPDLVIISAGFDAHHADPLGRLSLEARTFHTLARLVADWCRNRLGGTHVLAVLEGGYEPVSLARSVIAMLHGLGPGLDGIDISPEEPRFFLPPDRFASSTRNWHALFPEPWISPCPTDSAEPSVADAAGPAAVHPVAHPQATSSGSSSGPDGPD
ncbi:MAG: histone deacetylase [Candidatus Sericytochromatia bacterium]|nr:histone deacetylase [Candidatus Sericytochromatia bacterium]